MKQVCILLLAGCLFLSSCFETLSDTSINSDGSGKMITVVDLSGVMQMMAGQKKSEDVKVDTTIYLRTFSDTSSLLNDYQKKLVRDMTLGIIMEMSGNAEPKFKITMTAPFKSLDDFNALNDMMKEKKYDPVFNKAMKFPGLSDKEDEESGNNSFESMLPGFYNCHYSKNSIVCKMDSAVYKQKIDELKKMEMDIESEMAANLFSTAKFSNKITLPRKPKKVEGGIASDGSAGNVLVQSGNILELYRNPGKYEYRIEY